MKNNDIGQELERFYSDLYDIDISNPSTPSPMNRSNKIKTFLDKFCPKVISPDSANNLECPISQKEWDVLIKQIKSGKRPGPDSLSAIYYKTFAQTLSSPFLRTFNSLSHSTPLMHEMLEAHITVVINSTLTTYFFSKFWPIDTPSLNHFS